MKVNQKSEKAGMVLAWVLFTMYIITLFYFMFFSERYGRNIGYEGYNYNLTVFHEIHRFWKYRNVLGLESVVVNLLGNVAGFIPFGAVLPFLSKKKKNIVLITLLTFEFSLLIEVIQLISKAGCFDVDDLILNTAGGIIGYLLYKLVACLNKVRRKRK